MIGFERPRGLLRCRSLGIQPRTESRGLWLPASVAVLLALVGQAGGALPQAAGDEDRGFRKLAPGVETTVHAEIEQEETNSRHDIVEILAHDAGFAERPWSQDASPAKSTVFRRTVWGLDFTFKPVRFIEVDVPSPTGKMQRKLVWYMVYRVTNPGGHLRPAPAADPKLAGRYDAAPTDEYEKVDQPVMFVPRFMLYSPELEKLYPDRVIPVAAPLIQQREDPRRKLLNTAEIAGEIPVGKTVWGVVAWEDVDPRIDRFSIFVQGLTNAYRWVDAKTPAGDYRYQEGQPVGAHRRLSRKTLQLNFWRPGDEFHEHEREIRLGPPGDVDYRWVYR